MVTKAQQPCHCAEMLLVSAHVFHPVLLTPWPLSVLSSAEDSAFKGKRRLEQDGKEEYEGFSGKKQKVSGEYSTSGFSSLIGRIFLASSLWDDRDVRFE